jgi:hypothetical protein
MTEEELLYVGWAETNDEGRRSFEGASPLSRDVGHRTETEAINGEGDGEDLTGRNGPTTLSTLSGLSEWWTAGRRPDVLAESVLGALDAALEALGAPASIVGQGKDIACANTSGRTLFVRHPTLARARFESVFGPNRFADVQKSIERFAVLLFRANSIAEGDWSRGRHTARVRKASGARRGHRALSVPSPHSR